MSSGCPEALLSSASSEWYTPQEYVDAAREVMGAIDLDPASCAVANRVVRACHFYDRATNGLSQPWRGRVWLNPPYGRKQVAWVDRLIADYEAGHVTQAVLLVKPAVGSKWFNPLLRYPMCLAARRIRFWTADETPKQPTHGNAFFYFGARAEAFRAVFGRVGGVFLSAS